MALVKTGVFATEDEFNDLMNLSRQGWQLGDVMIVSSVMEGIVKDKATKDAKEICHKLALSHGLPEITGVYGITNNKEFAKFDD